MNHDKENNTMSQMTEALARDRMREVYRDNENARRARPRMEHGQRRKPR